MRPLGKHQLRYLAVLGNPGMHMVVGDTVTRSLAKRGLLEPAGEDSFYRITPAGLRALADAVVAGKLDSLRDLRSIKRRREAR